MSKIALHECRGPLTDLIEKLSGDYGSDWLKLLKKILRKDTVIDCDADPFTPDGWQVEQHIKGGSLEWNPNKVQLFFAEGQKTGTVRGLELRKELKKQPVLNANVLDWLLAHPEFIPDSWKGKYTPHFWGTVYRDADGDLIVRYLYWDGDRWRWGYYYLNDNFHGDDPAALRKVA